MLISSLSQPILHTSYHQRYKMWSLRLLMCDTCQPQRIITRTACQKPTINSQPSTINGGSSIETRRSTDKKVEQQFVAPTQLDMITSHKLCIDQVKRYDRENYLAALCIDSPMLKRTAFALRAFNVELALIRDVTTNSDRAKIRFHFWSRLIDEIVKRREEMVLDLEKDLAYYKHTPVAKEMLDLFRMVDVNEEIESYLKDLVGARLSSKVLGYKSFMNMEELELYCKKSNSSLYQLAWRIDMQMHNNWNPEEDMCKSLGEIALDVGIAHGLSNIMRGIPYNSTKNCCYIPQELLDQFKLTNRDFVTKKLDGEKIRPVVEFLADRAQKLLTRAYHKHGEVPNYFRQLFLPRVAIQANLNILKKCNYNICDARVNRRNELLPMSMKLSSKYFRAPIL